MKEVDTKFHPHHAPAQGAKLFRAAWDSDAGQSTPSDKHSSRVASEAAAAIEAIVWSHGGVRFATQIVETFITRQSIRPIMNYLQPSGHS